MKPLADAQCEAQSPLFLTPCMRIETTVPGQVPFNKGDTAERIFLLREGCVRLTEINKTLGPGDKVIELFFQDPRFGLFVVRAISQ